MVKIVIVDKNNKVIGSKERSLIETEDIYRSSALWLKNSNGQSLLARRALTKKIDSGMWGPAAAGTVEEGETYEENIKKEIFEELGLHIETKKGPVTNTLGQEHQYFFQWFTAQSDKEESEFKIDTVEVEEVKWFSKDDFLDHYNKSPNDFLQKMVEIFDLLG